MRSETRSQVFKAVQSLKPPLREAILLRYWAAHSYREMLDVITDGYMVARYADDLPTVAQAQPVQEAWTRLDASLMAQERDESGAEASSS